MSHGPSLKQRLNKATLEKLYHKDRLSTLQIAARYGAHSPNILKLMDEYGIPRRSRGGGKGAAVERNRSRPGFAGGLLAGG